MIWRAFVSLVVSLTLLLGATGAARAEQDPSFRDGKYKDITLTHDVKVYRVSGGTSLSLGTWFTTQPPRSREWAQQLLALPAGNTAERYQEIVLKAGTRVRVGFAAKLDDRPGGGFQIRALDEDWATTRKIQWGAMHDTPTRTSGPYGGGPAARFADLDRRAASLGATRDAPWAGLRSVPDPRPGGVELIRPIPVPGSPGEVTYLQGVFTVGGAVFHPECSEEEIATVYGAVFHGPRSRIVIDCTRHPFCDYEGPVGDGAAHVGRLLMVTDMFLGALVEGVDTTGEGHAVLVTSTVPSYRSAYERRLGGYRDGNQKLVEYHRFYQAPSTHYMFSISPRARFHQKGEELVLDGPLLEIWRDCGHVLWDGTIRHGASCDERLEESAAARDIVDRFDAYADAHGPVADFRRFARLFGFLRWAKDSGAKLEMAPLERRWSAMGEVPPAGYLRIGAPPSSAAERAMAREMTRLEEQFLDTRVYPSITGAARRGYEERRARMAIVAERGPDAWSERAADAGGDARAVAVEAARWHEVRAGAFAPAVSADLPPALGFVATLARAARTAELQHAASQYRRHHAWREVADLYRGERYADVGEDFAAVHTILDTYRVGDVAELESPIFKGPDEAFVRDFVVAAVRDMNPLRAEGETRAALDEILDGLAAAARLARSDVGLRAARAMKAAVFDAAQDHFAFAAGGYSVREHFALAEHAGRSPNPLEAQVLVYSDALDRRQRTRSPLVSVLELVTTIDAADRIAEQTHADLSTRWRERSRALRDELCGPSGFVGASGEPRRGAAISDASWTEIVARTRRVCARAPG
jgi:hypothetical protein